MTIGIWYESETPLRQVQLRRSQLIQTQPPACSDADLVAESCPQHQSLSTLHSSVQSQEFFVFAWWLH